MPFGKSRSHPLQGSGFARASGDHAYVTGLLQGHLARSSDITVHPLVNDLGEIQADFVVVVNRRTFLLELTEKSD